MPKKNSLTKAVRSFRVSLECGRHLKDIFKNTGLTEGVINLEYGPNSAS
jgi:hypothetical protein